MSLQRHKGRTAGIMLAATLAAMLLGGSAPGVRADGLSVGQETSPLRDKLVDIELADARMPQAVRMIQDRTGINLVYLPSESGYNPVTLSLRQTPADQALRLIAKSAGADFWYDNGVYFVGPKGSGPKPIPVLPVETEIKQPMVRELKYEKIRLMYSEPQAILHQLGIRTGPLGSYMDDFTAMTLKSMLSMESSYIRPAYSGQSSVVVQPVAPGVPTGTSSLSSGQPTGARIPEGGYTPPNFTERSGVGDQGAQRDGSDSEFQRQGFPGGGFPGGGQGFPGGGAAGAGQQPGGGIPGQGGVGQQGGAGVGLLPNDIQAANLYAQDADNSIIVRYTDETALRQLREIIRLLDVKPRQIMIKAEFITVTQNDVNASGITFNFQKVNLVGGVNTGFLTQNTAFLQFATGNIQAALSFFLTEGRGKIVSAPIATTLNNVPVTFQNQTQVPIFLSTPVISANGTVVLAPQINIASATIQLQVLPRINGDESISLTGTVNVGDLGAPVVGPSGESAPTFVNQAVQIQRIIRNGDTMVIGGLTRKSDTITRNKVPLLADLPLIGSLFQSRSLRTDDSELLIFVTPMIIPERQPLNAIGGGAAGGGGGNLLQGPGGGTGGITP